MEIEGRICKEVKINKCIYYFITSYKGKDYKKLMELQFGKSTTIGENGEISVNIGETMSKIPDMFPVLCLDILDNDNHIKPTPEYLESLPIEDYIEIQDIIIGKIYEIANLKKKTK